MIFRGIRVGDLILGDGFVWRRTAEEAAAVTVTSAAATVNAAAAATTVVSDAVAVAASAAQVHTVAASTTLTVPTVVDTSPATVNAAAAATSVDQRTALTFVWVGAVTATSATVKARLSAASATLHASPGDIEVQGVEGNDDVFTFELTGLTADTEYTLYIDAGTEGWSGTLKTFPTSGSFTFAAGGDSGHSGGDYDVSGVSPDAPTWDAIAAKKPLFFLHMGDLHYKDISSNNVALFRAAYRAAITGKTSKMLRTVPMVYVWDDHDYGGNDSHGGDVAKPAAAQAYREYVPHYTLPASDGYGLWQTFTCGRVRFIITDGRSQRSPKGATDNESKVLLGAEQEAWLDSVLSTATEELIVLVLPNPWIQSATAGSDSWGGYTTERRRIAKMFTKHGVTAKLLILSADAHMMAMDNGENSQYDPQAFTYGPRLAQLGGIDAGKINIGGPYSEGIAATSARQIFGTVDVIDDGNTIQVTVNGWSVDAQGAATLEQSMTFTSGTLTGLPVTVDTAAAAVTVSAAATDLQVGGDVNTEPAVTVAAAAATSLALGEVTVDTDAASLTTLAASSSLALTGVQVGADDARVAVTAAPTTLTTVTFVTTASGTVTLKAATTRVDGGSYGRYREVSLAASEKTATVAATSREVKVE